MPANVEPYRPEVTQRAQYRCEYCHYPEIASNSVLEIDHIYPQALDGQTVSENLALACPRCNGRKRDKITGTDPETGKQLRLFNPRLDDWKVHFRLDTKTGFIIGLTDVGRATANQLSLNAPRAITNRLLLIQSGIFPGHSS